MKARQSLLAIVSSLVILTQVSQPLGYALAKDMGGATTPRVSGNPGSPFDQSDSPSSPAAPSPPEERGGPAIQPQEFSDGSQQSQSRPVWQQAPTLSVPAAGAVERVPTAPQGVSPLGNYNYGQSYKDTNNPEDHPGRHFAGPVNLVNGNLFLTVGDHFFPSPGLSVQFARSYNHQDPTVGPLGRGWTHSYNSAVVGDTGTEVTVRGADGTLYVYTGTAPIYLSPPGTYRLMQHPPAGPYLVRHKSGLVEQFDPAGRLRVIGDRNNNQLQFGYDGLNRLVMVTDTTGARNLLITYNPTGTISSVADPIGRVTTYEYDANSNLTRVSYPEGSEATYTYDLSNRLASYNDPRQPQGTGQATIQYDGSNRANHVEYLLASFFDVTYLITETQWTDAVSITHRIQRDANFNVTFDGAFFSDCACWRGESWTYDSSLLAVMKVDANGNQTQYNYDALGNLVRVMSPSGAQTAFGYDLNLSNVTSTTNPAGYTTLYEYDMRGNLVTETAPLGKVISYTTDLNGNLLSRTDSGGNTTAYAYDTAGNLTNVIDPGGKVTTHTYDIVGRVISTTDPAGGVTTYQYDAADRLIRLIDPLGGTMVYTYDVRSNLVNVRDAAGGVISHTYDLRDRLTSVTDPLGRMTTYQYDTAGRLTQRTDATGAATGYTYDAASRLIRRTYSGGRQDTFTYDPGGRLTLMSDGTYTVTQNYDQENRLVSISLFAPDFAGTAVLSYEYDPMGNRTRTTVSDGTLTRVTTYTYDALNRLIATVDSADRAWSTTYDAAGRRATRALPDNSHEEYDYDTRNNLVQLRHYNPGNQLIRTFSYTYDSRNNMLTEADGGQVSTYQYDALSRVIQALTPDGNAAYTYNAAGNRLTATAPEGTINFTYDAAGHLLTRGNTAYQYDLMGRRIGETGPAGTRTYAYDGEMRLDSFFDVFANVSLDYDPMGQLVRKDSNGQLTYYLRGDGRLEAELDSTGHLSRTYTIDTEIVAMNLVSVSPITVDYHYDGRGRVRWVTSAADGSVVAEYGTDLTVSSDNFYNPIRIVGAYYFPELGLYYFGDGQFWDPFSGVFLFRFWPWPFWPFGPFSPWRPIFRYWPWPWPWPRPWGWPWPRPWPWLWPWPGIWVRPFIIWPMWPWPVQPWWPWWWWWHWWGWPWWGHWWWWHVWWWWRGWWFWGWWCGWWWWPWFWWPWWWWWPCWWMWWIWWFWWIWWWWWWPWWGWWGWGWWWCWWWWGWWWIPWYWVPYLPRPPDYGDAPDPPYPSLLVSNGARHLNPSLEWLGPSKDREFDAEIVNLDAFDDGVTVNLAAGLVTFTVSTAGYLWRYGPGSPVHVHGWIDWNADGDWADAGEFVLNWSGYDGSGPWVALASGATVAVPISVPAALPLQMWSRVRLDYAQNVEAVTGPAWYGEVEDYPLFSKPNPPPWAGMTNVDLTAPLVITYLTSMVTPTVDVSITPTVVITKVWSGSSLLAPLAPNDTLTLQHDPFAPSTTYSLTLSGGQTVDGHWLQTSTYTFTTTSAGVIYGVTVSPAAAIQSGNPGSVVTYTLTVTNTGNATDSFTVTVSSPVTFTASVTPTTVSSLSPNASAIVTVRVSISPSAPDNAMGTSQVTIRSQGDGSTSATASLTTTAIWRRLYLPLVLR